MAVDVVFDSPNYARVVRWLQTYGSKELKNEMTKSLTKTARPIRDEIRKAIKGGRSQTVSRARQQRAMAAAKRTKAYRDGDYAKRTEQYSKKLRTAGLRDTIARGVNVENRTAGPRAGVRIVQRNSELPADQKKLPRHINRGYWRHPVFDRPGKKKVWVEQRFSPGFFDGTVRRYRPKVREQMEAEWIKWVDRAGEEMQKAAKERKKEIKGATRR